MPKVSNYNLDNFIDTDDESCSISELLQNCNDGSKIHHDLCGDALVSQLTRLGTSPSQPSLALTYNGDVDSQSALNLLSNQIWHDGEDTATSSECLSREFHSDRMKPPNPPIMFANVPMNRIRNRSNATPEKSAATASVALPPSQSLSCSNRLQQLRNRRRSIEVKHIDSSFHLSSSRDRALSLDSSLSSNTKNSSINKESRSHQCSDKNGSVLRKRSNAEVAAAILVSLPFVLVTWFVAYLRIQSK